MQIKRRILSLTLAVLMIVGTMAPAALADDEALFTDHLGHWAEETITKWLENEWIEGYPEGVFLPDKEVSRAEFAKMVDESFGFTEEADIDFTDVDEDEWYYSYIRRIVAAEIMEGDDGKFEPDVTIPREQAAAVLTRVLTLTADETVLEKFPDADDISDWAVEEVSAAVAKGIMKGDEDGNLNPDGDLTRAQAVTILDRALELFEDEDPTVRETAYGPVQGFTKDDAIIWLGVPYGAEPEGELRWKAPQSPEPWEEVLDATDHGDTGYHQTDGGGPDCLNLDIYRPDNGDTDLPVLFFIHGGNNQSGASSDLNGSQLAAEANVIVVSVNYRLGLLGFNPLPALKTGTDEENSGNFAMLDIVFALDWVADNITAFGGDPENITVSGHSAGGRDVMALLISPIAEGKFQKAISFSGGMTTAEQAPSEKVVAGYLAPLVVEDEVKDTEDEAIEWLLTDDEEVAEYLYEMDSARLGRLIGDAGIRMALFPHLFTDGTVLPTEGFDTTDYNEVPLIMLTSTGEFSFFALGSSYFYSDEFNAKTEDEQAAEKGFANKYGGLLYKLFNAQESAERMSDAYDAPIYIAEFNFGANEETFGDLARGYGAFHGVWIPFMDRTSDWKDEDNVYSAYFNSDGAEELSEIFIDYIGNFLWEGDPNGENLAEWTAWEDTADGKLAMVFDADEDNALVSLEDTSVDYDDIIRQIEEDDTVSDEGKDALVGTVLNGRWFSGKLDAHFGTPSLWPN